MFYGFRIYQSSSAQGSGCTSGGQDQDIIFNQVAGNNLMGFVGQLIVVATDNGTDPANAAVNDIIVQGTVTGAEGASQHCVNGLMAEADHNIQLSFFRNKTVTAFLVIADCFSENFLGGLKGGCFFKLNMH